MFIIEVVVGGGGGVLECIILKRVPIYFTHTHVPCAVPILDPLDHKFDLSTPKN